MQNRQKLNGGRVYCVEGNVIVKKEFITEVEDEDKGKKAPVQPIQENVERKKKSANNSRKPQASAVEEIHEKEREDNENEGESEDDLEIGKASGDQGSVDDSQEEAGQFDESNIEAGSSKKNEN